MYYFYRKSNWGHGICPLYRGCPPFGESVIRGFTSGVARAWQSVALATPIWTTQLINSLKIMLSFGCTRTTINHHFSLTPIWNTTATLMFTGCLRHWFHCIESISYMVAEKGRSKLQFSRFLFQNLWFPKSCFQNYHFSNLLIVDHANFRLAILC